MPKDPKNSFFIRTLRRLGVFTADSQPSPASDKSKVIDYGSSSEFELPADDEQRPIQKHIASEQKSVGGDELPTTTTTTNSSIALAVSVESSTAPLPIVLRDESFNIDHFILKNPDLPNPIAQQLALNRQSRPYDGCVMIPGPLVKELTETAQNGWHTGFWPDGTPANRERRWSGGEPGSGIGGVGGGGGCG
ncbi:uncharacterized protein AB675_1306 [Cyphellophora attinorum]|uniref:Uncharacterized protein n=1 Tax=Cyphellophora attinorum TaxID=1664694 RepID=A0A0N1NXV9_9EURO|nr:uncharacterized protein AB675_1306 [Phialophora attinorum]KPI35683.1 hypothetical protein AB675_1306 [Phialophora attinorum]